MDNNMIKIKMTTMSIPVDLLCKLREHKVHPRETDYQVLTRLLAKVSKVE